MLAAASTETNVIFSHIFLSNIFMPCIMAEYLQCKISWHIGTLLNQRDFKCSHNCK